MNPSFWSGFYKAAEMVLKKKQHHGPFIPSELAKGIAEEKEHSSNLQIRRQITKDHLQEFPRYYTMLEKAEGKAESKEKTAERKKKEAPAPQWNQAALATVINKLLADNLTPPVQ